MPTHHLVIDGQQFPMGAVRASDAGFLADAADPFVATGGQVAGTTCAPALEAFRIDIVATAEERPEEGDFFRGKRGAVDWGGGVHKRAGHT